MNRKRRAEIRRFAVSVAIAFPMMVALLFLMTRLILPSAKDTVVTRMIWDVKFQRTVPPPEPAAVRVFELPPRTQAEPVLVVPNSVPDSSDQVEIQDVVSDDSSLPESPAHAIDWWAEVRKITQESDEKSVNRWLLEQGHDRYVSIMQGPLPIRNSVRWTLPGSQEDITGYMNTYGDMEFKTSENCVVQTQVSARLDISDFARNLPMRVVCKSAPKLEFPFDRDDRQ